MLRTTDLRSRLKTRIRLLVRAFVTLSFVVLFHAVISTSKSFAVVTCGTQSCPENHYCKEEKSFLTETPSYRCTPLGEMSVSPCASCPDGTSCRADARSGSMVCAPDEARCDGPCPNGGSQVFRNGQCQCPSNNANNQQTSQNSNSGSCMGTMLSLREKCLQEIEFTGQTCDDKKDSGLSSISDQASQIALVMGQQTAGSVNASCSKMAQFSQAANAALAAYRLNCSSSISSCVSACDQAVRFAEQNAQCLSYSPQVSIDLPGISEATRNLTAALRSGAYNEMKEHRRSCDNFTAKINEANQAIANYAATSANSSQCANLTDGTGTPPEDFCKANPKSAACLKADCSNPQVAASNTICICANNPNDPRCNERAQHHASSGGEVFSGDYGSSLDRVNSANGTDFSGDVPNTPDIALREGSHSSDTSLDGSQGSSPVSPLGGSGSSANAGRGGGEGGDSSGLSKDINGGFYGGGGGTGGMGMNGSTGSAGYGGSGGSRSGTNAATGKPDLRQFLPGGMNDPRNRKLAGDSSPHGISGPHSNIWKNIQNRYRIISPSLMP